MTNENTDHIIVFYDGDTEINIFDTRFDDIYIIFSGHIEKYIFDYGQESLKSFIDKKDYIIETGYQNMIEYIIINNVKMLCNKLTDCDKVASVLTVPIDKKDLMYALKISDMKHKKEMDKMKEMIETVMITNESYKKEICELRNTVVDMMKLLDGHIKNKWIGWL